MAPIPKLSRTRTARRPLLAMSVCGVVLVALALAWTIGPFASAIDPTRIAAAAARLRDWPAAPFVVVACFVIGSLVAAPSTLMIATTMLLFGPARGAAYAYAGMLVAGSAIYAACRFAARAPVERWLARHGDPRLVRFHERVARHAFLAVALLRMTPVPYTLQNVVLGSARIGYGTFVVGTVVGILPITVVLAGLAAPLEAWQKSPERPPVAPIVAFTIVLAGVAWAVRRWWLRRPGAPRPPGPA